jgi:hypothetical protein
MIDALLRKWFVFMLPLLLRIPIKTRAVRLAGKLEVGWVGMPGFFLYRHCMGGGWILHVWFLQFWLKGRSPWNA